MSQFEQKLQSLSVQNAFMEAVELQGATKSFEAISSADTIDVGSRTVGTETAFDALSDSTTFVREQLTAMYDETRTQAKAWFRFSIIAAVIGFLLIAVGVLLMMRGRTDEALLTAISSIIPSVISALFFNQSRTANERMDDITDQLSEAREVSALVDIVNTIESPAERNQLKAEIVRRALGLQSTVSGG